MKRLKRLKNYILEAFESNCSHFLIRGEEFPCQKFQYRCSLCKDCYIRDDFKRRLDSEFNGYLIKIDEETMEDQYKDLKVEYPETPGSPNLDTNCSVEAIENGLNSYFDTRKCINVPNVSWGLLNHEADFVSVTKSGYLTEVEIKRSWSDFLADFKKKVNHEDEKVSSFYYCVPASIKDKVVEYLKNNKIWSDGVFYYNDIPVGETSAFINWPITYESKSFKSNLQRRALTPKEMIHVAHLGCMRVWGLKQKLAENKIQFETYNILENKLKNLLIENDRKESIEDENEE